MLTEERLVDARAAAVYLGVSYGSLQAHRNRGSGPPYYKFGFFVRYSLSALDEYMEGARLCYPPPDWMELWNNHPVRELNMARNGHIFSVEL